MLKMGSTADKREQYRLMRDAMEKRFLRVARGSLVGGVRLGMFTSAFYGIQNLLADVRGVDVYDVFNVVGAGSITAATFGLISEFFYSFKIYSVFYFFIFCGAQGLGNYFFCFQVSSNIQFYYLCVMLS